jgi:hypothetical protein
MMRRTGLGRHTRTDDSAGDPLDGLVNLFDIGIVLAVAFLIAGLGLTLNRSARRLQPRTLPSGQSTQALPAPSNGTPKSGRGQSVGTVYRLANGQLVLVKAGAKP